MVALGNEEQQKVVKMHTKPETLRNRKINATVIPAPRKSVKRMMFETMVHFLARLFSNPSNKVPGCSKMDPMDRATCRRKTERIYVTTDLN